MDVSIFSILGIIVLALAVIALTIWVAGISSRLKELSDAVMLEPIQGHRSRMNSYDDMYDLPPRHNTNQMYMQQERRVETRRAPGPQRGSAPQRTSIPQRNAAPQRDSISQRLSNSPREAISQRLNNSPRDAISQRLNNSPRDNYAADYGDVRGASYDYPASNSRELDPYGTQSYAPVQTTPSGMRQDYGGGFMGSDPYADDEFFETYRNRDDEGGYLRGRGRPTIPFGADKSIVDRRRDSYVGSVVDSDYDPDSIDFTRVQGYKRAGGRY